MVFVSIIGIIPIDNPAFWIPIGGMVVGNSMNISFLAINRTKGEIDNKRNQVEVALCLGASPQDALMLLDIIPTGLRVSVTPSLNNLRALGLVTIPGLMTGLLIGGVHPIAAAFYQVLIYVMIIASGLMVGSISSVLTVRNLFHKDDERFVLD
ncbi:MAG: ABC transporter permease [Candidatus Kariarchaeaceae archaeon]|jgi:putative ABC transport system permease protein